MSDESEDRLKKKVVKALKEYYRSRMPDIPSEEIEQLSSGMWEGLKETIFDFDW